MEDRVRAMVSSVQATCEPFCTCADLGIHGFPHLGNVAMTAGLIATELGVDVWPVVVGGFLHDCARTHDGGGRGHAIDSAILAAWLLGRFYPELDESRKRICDAISWHADGKTTEDPIAACVWDADRLDLKRLNRVIDPRFLSTDIAKRMI